MVKHIGDNEFNTEVLNEQGIVVVDFWATWCGPCKMIAPVIDELETEMTDVKFVKIDVDKNPSVTGIFKISTIPTLIMFKDGKPVDKLVGFKPKAALKETIKKHI